MEITFDPLKQAANIAKHGYDFADLPLAFFLSATILAGKQGRALAVGEFEGRTVTVVYVPLGTQGLSVISMRPASLKERKAHAEV